jgi:hypothetical protein
VLRLSLAVFFLVVALTSCKRTATTTAETPLPQPSARSQREPRKIEGCSLITKEEIGTVQETTVTDAKGSEGSDGIHLITQCYYATTGTNLSVSIAITQFNPNNTTAVSPRGVWEETFSRFREEKIETQRKQGEEKDAPAARRGREEGKERTPPKKIDGVGEEAFWTGNRFGGALYVLKGDVFIRISVGGPDNEETKIEKSTTLAQKALSRL